MARSAKIIRRTVEQSLGRTAIRSRFQCRLFWPCHEPIRQRHEADALITVLLEECNLAFAGAASDFSCHELS